MNTVTQEGVTKSQRGVSVSVTTGSGIKGAVLNVSRHYDKKTMRLDANGKTFDTQEEAWDFALERGYTRLYFTDRALRQLRVERGR
jgi:hypothetical protein